MSANAVDCSDLRGKAFVCVYIGTNGCYMQPLSGSARLFYFNLAVCYRISQMEISHGEHSQLASAEAHLQ